MKFSTKAVNLFTVMRCCSYTANELRYPIIEHRLYLDNQNNTLHPWVFWKYSEHQIAFLSAIIYQFIAAPCCLVDVIITATFLCSTALAAERLMGGVADIGSIILILA